MTLNHADIEKLAILARLDIDAALVDEVATKISGILSMVDALQAAQTADIAPMANPLDACQRLRPDEVTEPNRREEFLAIAPASENGLYLVPRVID